MVGVLALAAATCIVALVDGCGSGFKATGLGVSVESEPIPAGSSSVVTTRDSHAVQTGRVTTHTEYHYHYEGCPVDGGKDGASE